MPDISKDQVISEVMTERIWREVCGEPMPHAWPTRCRRDLSHLSPHAGWLDHGRVPTWPGAGNAVGAQTGANYRCWCTLRSEGSHAGTWDDPRWPADVEWLEAGCPK